jgi:hypothetical protein
VALPLTTPCPSLSPLPHPMAPHLPSSGLARPELATVGFGARWEALTQLIATDRLVSASSSDPRPEPTVPDADRTCCRWDASAADGLARARTPWVRPALQAFSFAVDYAVFALFQGALVPADAARRGADAASASALAARFVPFFGLVAWLLTRPALVDDVAKDA